MKKLNIEQFQNHPDLAGFEDYLKSNEQKLAHSKNKKSTSEVCKIIRELENKLIDPKLECNTEMYLELIEFWTKVLNEE